MIDLVLPGGRDAQVPSANVFPHTTGKLMFTTVRNNMWRTGLIVNRPGPHCCYKIMAGT